jgi:hypothetical protein
MKGRVQVKTLVFQLQIRTRALAGFLLRKPVHYRFGF